MKNDTSLLVQPSNEQKLELSKIRIHNEIDKYLEKNPTQSLNGISVIIKVNKETIYNWYYGRFKTSLKKENVEKLANLLKVNILYLLGESNYRVVGNDEIDLKELVGEKGLIGLKKFQNTIDEFKEIQDYIIFDDLAYTDIIGAVIGDLRFWRTLIHEAKRLISLETNEYVQNDFEYNINKDNSIDNPTRIDYLDIIHHVNAKAINKVFDEYIKEKKEELGIEEKEFEDAVVKGFCPECGKAVYQNPRGRRKKFCSDACRFAWKNKHPKPENWKSTRVAICPVCGKEFLASREYKSKRKYCSHACANRGRAVKEGGSE